MVNEQKRTTRKGIVYRAFMVSHRDLVARLIGDFECREDAEEAAYLDKCDEPSPDKGEFYSWHVHAIYNKLARKK